MKKLSFLATVAMLTAAGLIGCDRGKTARSTNSTETTASNSTASHARTASDGDVAGTTTPSATGVNPGSANGAGANLGTSASNNAAPSTSAANAEINRGSTAVSSSGAPGVPNANTGTSLNPHRIEENAQAASSTNIDPQQFVQEAASGGLFEVQSSQLALKKSSDQKVKDFAQQMITDHQKANDELKNLAKGENITVPDKLMPKHQQLLDRLNSASDDFDKQYGQIQKQAHEETVSLFENASKNLSDPQLKQFASQTLPTLQQHLQHANELPQ
jgi:putative membrane protein